MMLAQVSAVALNGFKEARRHRVTLAVGAFALMLILGTRLVMDVTVFTFERVLTDFGLGTMSVLVAFLAVFLSSGMMSREIERRTIYLIVTRPMSRSAFLVGRVLGNVLTLAVLVVSMAALLFAVLVLLRTEVSLAAGWAVLGIFVEAVVLVCLGVLLSTVSSQFVSAFSMAGLYIAGHLCGDIYRFSARSPSELVRLAGKVAYYLLPNLDRVDFKPYVAHELVVPVSEVWSGVAYLLGYAVVALVVASAAFERADFK